MTTSVSGRPVVSGSPDVRTVRIPAPDVLVTGGFHGVVPLRGAAGGPRAPRPARILGFAAPPGVVAPVVQTATLIADAAPVSVCVQGGEDSAAEMRLVLSALGYGAACTSVAETMICAYLRWGPAFVHRLGPDALLSLWDGRTGRLTLLRGRAMGDMLRFAADGPVVCFCTAPFERGCTGAVGGACVPLPANSAAYGRDVLDPGCSLTFEVRGSRLVTERRTLSAGTT